MGAPFIWKADIKQHKKSALLEGRFFLVIIRNPRSYIAVYQGW